MAKPEAHTAQKRLEECFADWEDKGRRAVQRFVVLSYDIHDDRRRNRMCKLLKDYEERVQYSVFECVLRREDLERLRERLKPLLSPEEDDVRFYHLCQTCRRQAAVWSRKKRRRWQDAVIV